MTIAKVYLIGSLRNPEVPQIANKIRELGFEVFDDWHPNGGYYTVDFYDPDGYILEVACKK